MQAVVNKVRFLTKQRSALTVRTQMETAEPAPTSSRLLKTLIVILLVILLAWPLTFGLIWGLNQAYTAIDPTRFPFSDSKIKGILQKTKADATEPEKGVALSRAMTARLEAEFDSTFGW